MDGWHVQDLSGVKPDYVRRYCLSDPSYVTELDGDGYTPLLAACMLGNAEMVKVLLEAGSDPNYVAPDGQSALKASLPLPGKPMNRPVFDMLFAVGGRANDGLMPALHIAAGRGSQDAVTYLVVEHGADPNLEDVDGCTPIHWAAGWGHHQQDTQMMRLLIRLGADATRRDQVGRSVADHIGPAWMEDVLRP